jgi:hypothetical protein
VPLADFPYTTPEEDLDVVLCQRQHSGFVSKPKVAGRDSLIPWRDAT